MIPRLLLLACTLTLAACTATPTPQEDIPTEPRVSAITAGTARDEQGNIVRRMKTFSPDDHHLAFNVEIEGVTKPTPVTAYWIIDGDESYFAIQDLVVTPSEANALFHVDRDDDWPVSGYTFRVEVGDAETFTVETFTYEIE